MTEPINILRDESTLFPISASVARIDRVIDDLRKRRGKIINRVNMRTHVWMIHQSRRKEA